MDFEQTDKLLGQLLRIYQTSKNDSIRRLSNSLFSELSRERVRQRERLTTSYNATDGN